MFNFFLFDSCGYSKWPLEYNIKFRINILEQSSINNLLVFTSMNITLATRNKNQITTIRHHRKLRSKSVLKPRVHICKRIIKSSKSAAVQLFARVKPVKVQTTLITVQFIRRTRTLKPTKQNIKSATFAVEPLVISIDGKHNHVRRVRRQ